MEPVEVTEVLGVFSILTNCSVPVGKTETVRG
jgi:hypothetical protein